MNDRVLLIVNPCAGMLRSREHFFNVCEIFSNAGWYPTVMMTERQGHAVEMSRESAGKYDKIVCCGGDGTLHEVICGLMDSGLDVIPNVGYIPAGTTNDFAENFGLPTEPVKAAKRIVKAGVTNIDVGKFGTNSGDKDYFTYVASTGAFTDTSYRTPQKAKNAIGYMAYVLDAITHLGSIKPVHMRVTAGDQVFEDDYIYVSVSNSTTVAKVIKIDNVGVDMCDGLFELILIKNPKSIKDAEEIARCLLVKNNPNVGFVRTQAEEITFDIDEDTMWTLDGEVAKAGKHFSVKNLCRKIPFIA